MAGGGTAEGMKVSDVFILIGISVLVAGFIIHSWVAPEVLESEDGESAVIEKSALLLKNDKLVINLDVETGDTIYVTVNAGDEQYQLIPLSADSSDYEFTAKESGEYQIQIQVNPSSEGQVEGSAVINVQRSLMFDFIVYPIGALLLSFGLYKRKEEQSNAAIDAELN